MYQGVSSLDQAIAKYGGADEAYKLDLKKTIREAMGYSNYLSKINALRGKDLDIGDVEGMTPEGIKSMVSGAAGMQQQEMGSLERILGGVDTAAGQIAAAKAASDRAAAGRKKDNPFADVTPQNWVQSEVLAYAKNPYNQDGTLKTRAQLSEELKGQFIGEEGVNQIQGVTQDTIDATINNLLPQDFEQNASFYKYQAMGYTKAQAEDLKAYDEYSKGQMPEAQMRAFELMNPGWTAKADIFKTNQGLLDDIGMVKDETTGQTVPKYNFEELKNKYPNMPETDLKNLVKPVEKQSAVDDISQWLSTNKKAVETKIAEDGYVELAKDPDYVELKTKLNLEYGQVLTMEEIEQLIYRTINSSY